MASADLQGSPLWDDAPQNAVALLPPNSQPYPLNSGGWLGLAPIPLPVLCPESPRLLWGSPHFVTTPLLDSTVLKMTDSSIWSYFCLFLFQVEGSDEVFYSISALSIPWLLSFLLSNPGCASMPGPQ